MQVHDDWLRCMKTKVKGPLTLPPHPSVEEGKIKSYTAGSNKIIPKPWSRITIKVIEKEDKMLTW